jgi:hypothetical protein
MYLTLVLFHVFQHYWLLTWRILGLFVQRYLISIRISRVVLFDFIRALVAIAPICIQGATELFVYRRRKWLCEEISFVIGFVAKRMETFVDTAGAFIVFALHWSIGEWANCAGLG